MTKEEQWIKESIENFIFAYTGKRAKISDADAQHFTASVMSYLNLLTPSLPSDMDEAAQKVEDYYDVGEEHGYLYCHRGDIKDTFKAGAEWVAGQVVKAHCVESCNPVSNSEDENLHLITLVYAKNENTPYVLAGDQIEIILRKK